MKTCKFCLLILITFLNFVPAESDAGEWTNWTHYSSSGAVELHVRYYNSNPTSKAQWKIVNKTPFKIRAVIEDKIYLLHGGRKEKRIGEAGVVASGRALTFGSDFECDGMINEVETSFSWKKH